LKALREEPYESTLPPRGRRTVRHAQRHDRLQHQSIALATLTCDGLDDGELTTPGTSNGESLAAATPVSPT